MQGVQQLTTPFEAFDCYSCHQHQFSNSTSPHIWRKLEKLRHAWRTRVISISRGRRKQKRKGGWCHSVKGLWYSMRWRLQQNYSGIVETTPWSDMRWQAMRWLPWQTSTSSLTRMQSYPEQTTSCRPCGGTIPLTVTSLDHTTPAVVPWQQASPFRA